MSNRLYHYRGKIVRVVDGDTVDMLIDMGFSVFTKQRVRLNRINAPEGKMTEAHKYLIKIAESDDIIIKTTKEDSFGRWLGDLYLEDTCINDQMVHTGLAEWYRR